MEPASAGSFPQPCGYSFWHLWFSIRDGLRVRGWRYHFLDTAWFLRGFRGSGVGPAPHVVTSSHVRFKTEIPLLLTRRALPCTKQGQAHEGHKVVGGVKKWCFRRLVLNKILWFALLEHQAGGMQLSWKQQGSPTFKGQDMLLGKVFSLQLKFFLVILSPFTLG